MNITQELRPAAFSKSVSDNQVLKANLWNIKKQLQYVRYVKNQDNVFGVDEELLKCYIADEKTNMLEELGKIEFICSLYPEFSSEFIQLKQTIENL